LKHIIRIGALGALVVIVLASLVHPSGNVKSTKSEQPLFNGAAIDTAVLGVIERSCQNCHSEKTEWPWYSQVAPMSWMVERDVSQARGHMNLSQWDAYTNEQKREILGRIAAVIRSRHMPPDRYTVIHPDAKLTQAERDALYDWAHAERRRVKSSVPALSVP